MDTSSNKLRKFLLKVNWIKWNLKRETESLLIAVQNNIIRANYEKSEVDNTQENVAREMKRLITQ